MDNDVRLTGIEIPFMDLVTFLVKLAVALIPAAIIVGVLGFFVVAFMLAAAQA